MTEEQEYIPGVCNIGKHEVNRRRYVFIAAILLTVVWATLLFALGAPKLVRLTLIIPTTVLGITFQQWYYKFCIGYAYLGLFNFKDLMNPDKVTDNEYRKKDMLKVRAILISSFLYGLVITLTAYFVK